MMTATIAERACQLIGEVHEDMQTLQKAAPTADRDTILDEIDRLLDQVAAVEQLTDAVAMAIAHCVASLRLGPDAQRTRKLARSWRDTAHMDAVQQVTRLPRIRRREHL